MPKHNLALASSGVSDFETGYLGCAPSKRLLCAGGKAELDAETQIFQDQSDTNLIVPLQRSSKNPRTLRNMHENAPTATVRLSNRVLTRCYRFSFYDLSRFECGRISNGSNRVVRDVPSCQVARKLAGCFNTIVEASTCRTLIRVCRYHVTDRTMPELKYGG